MFVGGGVYTVFTSLHLSIRDILVFSSPEQRSQRAIVLPPASASASALALALAFALASASTVLR